MRATFVAWITPATSSPPLSITCVGVVLAPALHLPDEVVDGPGLV